MKGAPEKNLCNPYRKKKGYDVRNLQKTDQSTLLALVYPLLEVSLTPTAWVPRTP